MIPIPAIDLKGGKVVRLLHGNFKAETIYSDKPDAVAREFEAAGARRVHVVDLDGALKGKPANIAAVELVLRAVGIPVEVGGGIRDLGMVALYLEMGVQWAILGTQACLDPGFLREALTEFRDKIIVGIDAKDGYIATDGWTRVTGTKAVDLAKQVQEFGGRSVIYTDIAKDGGLQGPNLAEIRTVSEAVNLDVIASGGVGSLEDLENLKKLKRPNITGVIIGKAIYEKKFTLKDAIGVCGS